MWLTQLEMAELFQRSKKTVSEHLGNIFAEGELQESAVVRNFRTTASDGKNYRAQLYNLDLILAIGYRVRSCRVVGTWLAMSAYPSYCKEQPDMASHVPTCAPD